MLHILKSPLNLKRARSYKARYIALSILRTKTKLNEWRLVLYRERVRLMCFTCWLRSGLSHFINMDLRLVLTTSKVRNLFNVKDAVPEGLRTRVVYKFSCASCNACYVGETSRRFSTRVREHLLSDRCSNVFKHLQRSEFCRASWTPDCFEILDSAATKYQVKLKESMFIKWERPDLNQQVS